MENDALALIFQRNAFYRRMHFLVLYTLCLAIIVIAFLCWVLFFLVNNPTAPLYFPTDNVARIIPIIPVDKPNMSNDEVLAWMTEAVQNSNSYDFINFRRQLQSSQKYFTSYGWTEYMKALRATGNLLALSQRKQVVIAQIIGQPKLVTQGLLGGAYAWKFEFQLLVTYWEPPFDESSKYSNAFLASVIVQRQPILQSYRGLGIVQLIVTRPVSTGPQEISTTPTG